MPSIPTHFHTTRWTLVSRAGASSPEGRVALSELCEIYYPPVRAFVARRLAGGHAADDVTHEFFVQLLEEANFGRVNRQKGRFRSYLLGAVKHFLANQQRASLRQKRGGKAEHISIHEGTDTSPGVDVIDPAAATADESFDREWALAIVERALALLEEDYRKSGKLHVFRLLAPWLTPTGSPRSIPDLAGELQMSPGAVKVTVHRLRQKFREIVRREVAQTLDSPEDLDAEMQHLIAALAT